MTRALHITRDFPPRINGGISTAVGGLARALVSRGVACSVISFDAWRPSATGASADPPVRDGDVLRVTSPSQLAAAAAFAAEVAPTLVHVHHAMLWDFAMKLQGPKIFSLPSVRCLVAEAVVGLAICLAEVPDHVEVLIFRFR